MNNIPIFKELVLVGGGHTHALVLSKWAMNPLPGVRITLISPQTMTPYSGMLPGLIAGHYTFAQTHIDLVKLSLWANIRFIQDSVTAIDVETNTLALKNRPDIEFDIVSIDIGSTPNQQIEGTSTYTTPIKPISDFYQRWQFIQEQAQQNKIQSLGVIGGGAGSVEVIMSIAFKLQQINPSIHYHLVTASSDILPGYPRSVITRVKQQLEKYRITVHPSTRVEKLSKGVIHCQNAELISADEIIWCTQASGAKWLQQSQLQCDDAGFVKVRQTLQSLEYEHIFAAGDIANMIASPRPKAGVYAVRQAPILFHNLRAALLNQTLIAYKPQDGFLSLLALGEKQATGTKSLFSFSGDWVWRWKDSIDVKFMHQFHFLPELSMPSAITTPDPQLIDEEDKSEQHDPLKRCSACGAKVGSDILKQVLNEVLGDRYYQPQDAVQISPEAALIYQSVDALKAPMQDIWLFGKIAVNHALSDLYAMNLKPESAQVLISLPYASPRVQKRQLKALMQGISTQLDSLQCRFLGGHTSEASELSIGLVVNGIRQQHVFNKQGLRPGDKLVLSKPLGSGLILAAAMQDLCDGEFYNQAIATMLQPNDQAAKTLSQLNVKACTDVTGFGLLGHLQEMCLASTCAASINLQAMPLLPGTEALALKKITSSLYKQNRKALASLKWPDSITQQARFNILFDPQTSGGLLAGIPAADYARVDKSFHHQFYTIGEVLEFENTMPRIIITDSEVPVIVA